MAKLTCNDHLRACNKTLKSEKRNLVRKIQGILSDHQSITARLQAKHVAELMKINNELNQRNQIIENQRHHIDVLKKTIKKTKKWYQICLRVN